MATTTSSSKSHFLAGPADSDGLGVFYCGLCVVDGTCVCLCLCNTHRERGKEAYLPSPISSKRSNNQEKPTPITTTPYSKKENIPLLIKSPYLLLHLGRRLRLPRPQHPNYQTGRLLRYHQYQHHQCHYSHAAATFCRSGSFWFTRRSVWEEMADGMLCVELYCYCRIKYGWML